MNEAVASSAVQLESQWKPYPAYKDSGIEWLGEIPAHWEAKRLKFLTEFVTSGSRGWAQYYSDDGAIFLRIGNLSRTSIDLDLSDIQYVCLPQGTEGERTRVKQYDILISITAYIGSTAIVTENIGEAYVNQHIALARPRRNVILPKWLGYCLISQVGQEQFGILLYGGTKDGLGLDDVDNLLVVMPSQSEQEAIVDFLDHETAKIDALIAKKERLIELLTEKRTALISHAVTKGLDPTVPMQDSGVEWIGEIPAHWAIKQLMRLTPDHRSIMYGIVLPGPNVDDGVPIVKGGDVSPDRLRLDLLNRTTREIEARYERSRLSGGDIVYAIRGSIGMVEIVPCELEGVNLTQDAARVAPKNGIEGQWLLFALKSRAVFAQLDAGAIGATIRGINIRDLKRAAIAVPPPDEQREIAKYLACTTAKIDTLIAKVREHIDKLKEYRTALISAAVTGKIDVRPEVP